MEVLNFQGDRANGQFFFPTPKMVSKESTGRLKVCICLALLYLVHNMECSEKTSSMFSYKIPKIHQLQDSIMLNRWLFLILVWTICCSLLDPYFS